MNYTIKKAMTHTSGQGILNNYSFQKEWEIFLEIIFGLHKIELTFARSGDYNNTEWDFTGLNRKMVSLNDKSVTNIEYFFYLTK